MWINGTNRNSRYKYNYICSYNAYKVFKYDKTDDGLDKLICIPVKNIINNNDVINNFINEYKDNRNYYCSRIDKPRKNKYIKSEYGNGKVDTSFIFFPLGLLIWYSSISHSPLFWLI